jgi:hypothetical protein
MTSASQPDESALGPPPKSGASPAEVRAALWPEYRDDFDRAYQEALAEAGRTLDLTGLHRMVEQWRMRACLTRDQAEHRRVVRRAAELVHGEAPPEDEPVAVTEMRL